MRTLFVRLLESNDKAADLRNAVCGTSPSAQVFTVDLESLRSIPGSPFAYWVSEPLRRLFPTLPQFESGDRIARKGLTTSDDARYVRCWWEPNLRNVSKRWATYAKGGSVKSFYADLFCVVRWDWKQRTIPGYIGRPGRESPTVECADLMGKPGLTWPLRASTFSPSAFSETSVFSARGYVIQAPRSELLWLLAFTSSAAFDAIFKMCLGRSGYPEFIVGVLQRLPLPEERLDDAARDQLSALGLRAWSLRRSVDTSVETSHAFTLPALLQADGNSVSQRSKAWIDHRQGVEEKISEIQHEIDDLCFSLYRISENDRRSIVDGFASFAPDNVQPEVGSEVGSDGGVDDGESNVRQQTGDERSLVSELISWTIGVAFGRFDVRLATGAHMLPPVPEPFDTLPTCSPGMLSLEATSPSTEPLSVYPHSFPSNGILTDDPGHERDVIDAIRSICDVTFGDAAGAIWDQASELLDPKGKSIRSWLAAEFFDDHMKRYSMSRRKAPQIWQIAVPSRKFSVWMYSQNLTRDSFIQVQNDITGPKLAYEELQLTNLMQASGDSGTFKEVKEIETQKTFVEELRELHDEIKRVAPLWVPSLDDGVVLAMSPLWRLVPHDKGWQRELKTKWSELVAGKYDWSHLAMHYWPERVVPKCAVDRSLAIAHGLEEKLWFEDDDGKWTPYEKSKQAIDALVRERTSGVVRAALKNLLEAPDAAGVARRTRRSRAA
jgi:hypothetical protein